MDAPQMTSRDEALALDVLLRFDCMLVRITDSNPTRYFAQMQPLDVGHWVRFADVVALLAASEKRADKPVAWVASHRANNELLHFSAEGGWQVEVVATLPASDGEQKEGKDDDASGQ